MANKLTQHILDTSVMQPNDEHEDNEQAFIECGNDVTLKNIIVHFCKTHSKLTILFFVFVLIIPFQAVAIPSFMSKLYSSIQNKEPISNLLYIIITLILILQVLWLINEYVEQELQYSLQKYVMDKIMNHIFKINRNNYNEQHVSSTTLNLNSLPSLCYQFIFQFKSVFIPSIVALIYLGFYILYLNLHVGFVYFLVMGITLFCIYHTFKKCVSLSYACSKDGGTLFSDVDDTLRNMSTIINANKIQSEIERMSKNFLVKKDTCKKTNSCVLQITYIVLPLIGFFVIYSLSYFFKLFKNKKIQSDKLVNIVVIIFMIMNTFINISNVLKYTIILKGRINSSLEVFDECSIKPFYTNEGFDGKDGIVVKNVHFSRFSIDEENNENNNGKMIEKKILHGINVHFPQGKKTLILGQIGSGKSTLLNILTKNQTISKGNIYYEGVSIKDISEIKQQIYFVPQSPILLNRTIYENIIYGINKQIEENEILDVMKQFGLNNFLAKLPKGLHTKVGLLGSNLSGGQRQVIWLIKLYFVDPEYIFMDEPTSAIDEDSKTIIYDMFHKILKNKTVIMITHDINLTQLADKMVYMKDGSIDQIQNN
jgi:ABC-type bacteriocin/lantibiotic exporter with double-glycine peptidase domain